MLHTYEINMRIFRKKTQQYLSFQVSNACDILFLPREWRPLFPCVVWQRKHVNFIFNRGGSSFVVLLMILLSSSCCLLDFLHCSNFFSEVVWIYWSFKWSWKRLLGVALTPVLYIVKTRENIMIFEKYFNVEIGQSSRRVTQTCTSPPTTLFPALTSASCYAFWTGTWSNCLMSAWTDQISYVFSL